MFWTLLGLVIEGGEKVVMTKIYHDLSVLKDLMIVSIKPEIFTSAKMSVSLLA